MAENIFIELSLIVILTTALAGIFRFLRQPIIIAYIAAGIILSPHFLNIVTAHDAVGAFSQFGIAFLLFMVGLNLNPQIVRDVGKISLITGLGQIFFTSVIGFGFAKIFGFNNVEAIYIAIALTFSSTIVIMKLLSDKKDLESVYGRISVGFLIVQDIVAMLILMVVSSTAGGTGIVETILISTVKGILLISGVFFISHYILPPVIRRMANQQELLVLFCVAWCFALAGAFYMFGFSIEIGALLAGISLSSSSYRYEISARIKTLRDFFILMFFVFLGTQMEFGSFQEHILPIIAFSAFILIGNPLIVMIIMGVMGYTKRTGFLAGLTVAQISEFSLILTALGVKMGHLDPKILSFVTIVGLITIGGSTYFIMYGKKIYHLISRYLTVFERKDKKKDEHRYITHSDYDVLIIGYNHVGSTLAKTISKMNKKFLVLDYNPETIIKLAQQKVECRYGDVEDADIFEDINFKKIKMVISSVKDFNINISLIQRIRELQPDCIIMVVSENINDALQLYEEGASYVIMPHFLGGHHTSTILEAHGFEIKKFMSEKIKHLEELKA
ncbi:cation:proton antiporter [Candidatus Peregrinibacteria bacterium]|nr:cation:proton antiporter [Candidatus Peregrinibacteria bacterium]